MKSPSAWNAVTVMLAPKGMPGHRATRFTRHLRRADDVGAPLNARVSYLCSGDPAGLRIIFVHGTPGNAEGWAEYLLNPPPGVELMALDRPGFGHSGPAKAVTSLEQQGAAVAALLPTDGRRAVLVGHSLGGAVVSQVAADHPQRVSAVVLIAAALDPSLERLHWLQPWGNRWPLCALLPRALRNANRELLVFEKELVRLRSRLGQISAPLAVVHGTQDSLVPHANMAYIQRQFIGVREHYTRTLDGHDHFLPWNAQREVRDALTWATRAAGGTP